jgi:hypothetical protein
MTKITLETPTGPMVSPGDEIWPGSPEWERGHSIKRTRKTRANKGRDAVNAEQRAYNARDGRVEERDRLIAESELSRPIVAVDSEGQDYQGSDVWYPLARDGSRRRDSVRYARHDTYLWAASTLDAEKRDCLVHPETRGIDKRALHAETIVDWLLTLPAKFGGSMITPKGYTKQAPAFVMFGQTYDVTMILKDMPLEKVRKIIAGEPWEFWRSYAFKYVKGKWLEIKRLRDPAEPWLKQHGELVFDKDGQKKLDSTDYIKIFEVFGYFQKAFASVVKGMVKRGAATEVESARIEHMKALRGKFAGEPIETIRDYCLTECRLLSQEMTAVREMIYEFGLRPRDLYGPGAAVTELYRKKKVMSHFGDHIVADKALIEPGGLQGVSATRPV